MKIKAMITAAVVVIKDAVGEVLGVDDEWNIDDLVLVGDDAHNVNIQFKIALEDDDVKELELDDDSVLQNEHIGDYKFLKGFSKGSYNGGVRLHRLYKRCEDADEQTLEDLLDGNVEVFTEAAIEALCAIAEHDWANTPVTIPEEIEGKDGTEDNFDSETNRIDTFRFEGEGNLRGSKFARRGKTTTEPEAPKRRRKRKAA